jgi:hypothetical protein
MLCQSERIRSFVDPATNTMVLADFDLPTYVAWLRGRPVIGSGVLANFLHEWTHRWCFHSLVGSAIALLRMRAATREYRGQSAFEDYVRCMTASMILEPLAEGLALFAEFDSYPGKSDWQSQTLTAASTYFSPAIQSDDRPLAFLEVLLQTLRRDPLLLERKAGIYCHQTVSTDPYLLGYLSVKSLWCKMASACSALNDRDLFLSYLRSHVYDDPGLVASILTPAPSEIHAAEQIVKYIISRFRKLVGLDGLSKRVERWLKSAHQGQLDVTSIGATARAEQEVDFQLYQALIADYDKGNPDIETFGAWMHINLEERQLCIIGSTDVYLRQSPDAFRVELSSTPDGEPLYTLAETLPVANKGELVIVGTSNATGLLVLLRVEQDVWLVSSFGLYEDNELELAKRHVANRPINQSVHEELRASIESSGVTSLVWKLVEPQVQSAVNSVYGPLCTLNAKEENWKSTFAELQRAGLFGILGEDGELVRAMAMIGLVNSFSTDLGVMKMMGEILDVGESALESAVHQDPIFGMPLVVTRGNSVMALV